MARVARISVTEPRLSRTKWFYFHTNIVGPLFLTPFVGYWWKKSIDIVKYLQAWYFTIYIVPPISKVLTTNTLKKIIIWSMWNGCEKVVLLFFFFCLDESLGKRTNFYATKQKAWIQMMEYKNKRSDKPKMM